MMEEEYDDEELYVYLPDCQHRIEVHGLDAWVKSAAEDNEFKGLVEIYILCKTFNSTMLINHKFSNFMSQM